MKELTENEVKTVNGGWGNLAWMVGGYIFGKVADAALEADWGDASDNPDTNLAP